MWPLILSFIVLVTTALFYKLLSFCYYYFFMRRRLGNATLDRFKEILGTGYRHREVYPGVTRLKWLKFWGVIRATFNNEGVLTEDDKPAYNFTSIISEYNFPGSNTINPK